MKVLVTGGAGFIGSHTVDCLVRRGASVAAVDNLSTGSREFLRPDVQFYEMDIAHSGLEEVFLREKPDAVIHLAAEVSVPESVRDPVRNATVNILGTLRVLECSRRSGARKFVYASSCAVYGDPKQTPIPETHPLQPLSAYGISKMVPEFYLRVYQLAYSMSCVALRYANVYGPRQRIAGEGAVVPSFITRLFSDQSPVIYGDGTQTRDFVSVQDVAEANVRAVESGAEGVFNISSGVSTSIQALYEMLKSETGRDIPAEYRPARPGDILHSLLDPRMAMKALGWRPSRSLRQGLRETARFFPRKGTPDG